MLISRKSHPAAVFTTCNPWEGVGFLSGLFRFMYSALLEIRFSAWFYFPDKIPWDKWEKCLMFVWMFILDCHEPPLLIPFICMQGSVEVSCLSYLRMLKAVDEQWLTYGMCITQEAIVC